MARRPETFPESEVATALSFFQHVKARFASEPAIYKQFLRLFRGFSAGKGADPQALKHTAYALLRGHADLVDRLNALFRETQPARREDAAPSPAKRERRPTATVAAVQDRADTLKALRFLGRVGRKRPELYDRLLKLIFDAQSLEDLNQVYRRALNIFGSADSDLLREFVEEYLPIPTEQERVSLLRHRAKKEPHPEEHRAQAPKRKAIAAFTAADNPSAPTKRPRADDRKTTNRRTNPPAVVDAPKSGEVSAFREAWEFETKYSKLVATARRTKELLKAYEPKKDGAPPPPPSGRRVYEELFPSRECQEVLREMYHLKLKPIQDALEDGARTELALRTIKRRLKKLEQLAVKVAMERRDPARVEGRMHKLAVDRVLILRRNKAKKSAVGSGELCSI